MLLGLHTISQNVFQIFFDAFYVLETNFSEKLHKGKLKSLVT